MTPTVMAESGHELGTRRQGSRRKGGQRAGRERRSSADKRLWTGLKNDDPWRARRLTSVAAYLRCTSGTKEKTRHLRGQHTIRSSTRNNSSSNIVEDDDAH